MCIYSFGCCKIWRKETHWNTWTLIFFLLQIRPCDVFQFRFSFWHCHFFKTTSTTSSTLGRVISPLQGRCLHRTAQHTSLTDIHTSSGIQTLDPSVWAVKPHAPDYAATMMGRLTLFTKKTLWRSRHLSLDVIRSTFDITSYPFCRVVSNVNSFDTPTTFTQTKSLVVYQKTNYIWDHV
jgi:hypothetical protein